MHPVLITFEQFSSYITSDMNTTANPLYVFLGKKFFFKTFYDLFWGGDGSNTCWICSMKLTAPMVELNPNTGQLYLGYIMTNLVPRHYAWVYVCSKSCQATCDQIIEE
jgi:hypothetical protein